MDKDKIFDVIIIGGSYAGLSAAMALGRSLREVLIIDSGQPCNRQTPHSHNFITQDGEPPEAIAEKAREQVLRYDTVKLHHDLAVSGRRSGSDFEITTQSGDTFRAGKLIFATGIKDLLPAIKGLAPCWGISVIHCPYCHGYEYRSRPTAIMANGDRAFHLASLVSNLTGKLSIFTHGKADFTDEQAAVLAKHRIPVVEKEVHEMVHEGGHIRHVVFKDGSTFGLDALYAGIPFEQHCKIPEMLGCELTDQGHIKTNAALKTNVEGIFACGDNTSMMRSVANAVSSGNLAGAMANNELAQECFLK